MEEKYSYGSVEQKIFEFWKNHNLFVPSLEDSTKPTYSILMPPPNVTNILHLGHALNNTLQDVMARYYRMQGYAVIWKIGVDHAGIATQNVVEKEVLALEGKTKEQLGKEKFVKKIWDWKHKYGSSILEQLKRLGVSGDWENERFTMDTVSSQAVKEIFVKLYNDGLVYRGEYIINWCPRCSTTLSDDEVEYVEYQGNLYYVRYFLEDGSYLRVATTRPETILADVALAVNPKDERYSNYIGQKVKVPGSNRWIPIISDSSVEIEFGTGVLKVTPFHDTTDFIIGQKHGLPLLEIIDSQGKMVNVSEEYNGRDRFDFRKIFTTQLKELDLLESTEPHTHSRGVCYRCNTVIEPRISVQWFVKMKKLAILAKEALLEKRVEFVPEKWEKVYYHWMDNIRDWSISRQLWWGHSIPAYYCKEFSHITVALEQPKECSICGSKELIADPDVLDTWFSSWIWPMTVFNASHFNMPHWQTEEFKKYYPTQYLATAPEIIFFWVARMIMAGLYLTKEVPFKKVFFNSTICDLKGRKMSKSLGNGIDPLDIITESGADALRFTLLFIAPKGERIRIDKKSFDIGQRLVTKIWNAARFILSYRKEINFSEHNSTDQDEPLIFNNIWQRWIVIRYKATVLECQKSIEQFDYHHYSHTIYHFFWNDFCDWFIETQKIYLTDTQQKEQVYMFLEKILEGILRLFHPIIPYITEEIWQNLLLKKGLSIMKKEFDMNLKISNGSSSFQGEQYIPTIQKMITDLRHLKNEFQLSPKQTLYVYIKGETIKKLFIDQKQVLYRLVQIEFLDSFNTKDKYVLFPILGEELYIKLPEEINIETELKRMQDNLKKIELEIQRAEGKLHNKKFIENAEENLIVKEKEKLIEFEATKKQLLSFITSFKGLL